jgi:uncharacterized protein DUF6714
VPATSHRDTQGPVKDEPGRRIAEQIGAAFRDVPALDPSDVVAPGPDVVAREEIRNAFAPWTWRTIPGEILLDEQGALSFMTPQGFRLFLPAYMLLSLSSPRDYGLLLDSVVFHLMPRFGREADLHERLNTFSPVQLEAIRDFLVYMRDREAADFERGQYDSAIGAVEERMRKTEGPRENRDAGVDPSDD